MAKLLSQLSENAWQIDIEFLRGMGPGATGIIAFAIASWLLLALMGSVDHRTGSNSREGLATGFTGSPVFSKALILIAIIAMLARLLSEPLTAWTPMWQSYSLTFAAATAMAMVLYRIRGVRNQ